MTIPQFVFALLEPRLTAEGREWFSAAQAEIVRGVDAERFCVLFSKASRHVARRALTPSAEEARRAAALVPGLNLERWTMLDTLRAALVLSRTDLPTASGAAAVEELFRYADMGELCAGYKLLALLPDGKRFAWRAGEGARSSMRAAYEAACCDTPFPATHFDVVAWHNALIKALFIEAPLWRVWGIDARLDADLARTALDLTDERRSAARPINPDTWMCLGAHGGERALRSIEIELAGGSAFGRAAASLALARAGKRERLLELAPLEKDAFVRRAMLEAIAGRHASTAWAAFDATRQGAR